MKTVFKHKCNVAQINRLLIIVGICMAYLPCFSTVINIETARENAIRFLESKQEKGTRALASEETTLTLAYTNNDDSIGYPLFYVFNRSKDNGFMIMAGDDCIDDVIGYSDKGSFNTEEIPDGLELLLEKYATQMRCAIRQQRRIEASGDNYADVAPLLTSTWNQNSPYNVKCPIGETGQHCPPGCIATAMAQIMYYHKWPHQGIRSNSYICKINNKENLSIELSADFGSTTYQWGKMLDSYKNGLGSTEERNEVATLLYHCGIALGMEYKDEGSSPSGMNEAMALRKYFRYDADVKSVQHVSDADFASIVYEELENERPVFVCGQSEDGKNVAHAFVCDGYRQGGYFHFNWGWGGNGDGYYLLTAMNPNDKWDFSYNHRIVYNIKPYRGEIPLGYRELNVSEAGQLNRVAYEDEASLYATSWKIKGKLNATDIFFLRNEAGRNINNETSEGILTELDLSEAVIDDGVETDQENPVSSKVYTFPERGLQGTRIEYVRLPENIIKIDRYAFAFCYSLREVEFGKDLKEIGFSAFNYTPMKEVIIPYGVETVGPYAFCNMNNLEKVEISESVKKIDYRAFAKDDNIRVIKCLIKNPFNLYEGDLSPFSDECYKNATLFVPHGTAILYKQKNGWKNFSKIVEQDITDVEEPHVKRDISVCANEGTLEITGLDSRDYVMIFNMAGIHLFSNSIVTGGSFSIKVPRKEMLIVKIGSRRYKVISE